MDLNACLDGFAHRDWQRAEEGTVRIAVVGLGWWTREEAVSAIAATEHCETTVVVSGSTERAEAFAAEHPTVERAIDYEAFHAGTGEDAYDAVYVATPNALHLEYVRTAADLGKAILCEKPMEASAERAERMVETCGDAGVPLMIAYRMQTEPAVRRLRRLVRDGLLGDPVSVHGHMSQPLLEMIPELDQWRLDPDLSGYGTSVMDLGIYPLNTTRFVLDADLLAARASMTSSNAAFADVPDERASFTLDFSEGISAVCTASQNAHRSSHLRITGTEGEARLEPAFFPEHPRQLTLSRGGTTVVVDVEPVDQMEEEFAYFADRVLTGRVPTPDGEHALVDMQALSAVYEAAETGATVSV